MAKTLSESKLTTRAERRKLAESNVPYWRSIDPDVHLGYRKGRRGGTWLVRWRHGKGYRHKKLSTADDELHEGTLDFDAAVRAARAAVEAERLTARAASDGTPLTVASAVQAYVLNRDDRETRRKGRPTRSDANRRMARYIIGREEYGARHAIGSTGLAALALHELAEDDLLLWRDSLPANLKFTTKQRLVNDLKAALNGAYLAHRRRLPPTFPAVVKHGLTLSNDHSADSEDVARDNQTLTDAQVTSLISAAQKVDSAKQWDGDLYRMVAVMAATGARFSQIARLRVGDLQLGDRPRLMMPCSHKGNGRKVTHTPVPIGRDLVEVLLPATEGRPKAAILLNRWRNKQVAGTIRWERTERGEWRTSSELNRPWDEIRTIAGLPEVIQYALRHSSIIRWLRSMVPLQLVAVLHDTSEAMIRRHYGRYIADSLDELAARAVVPLMGTTARVAAD